MQHAHTQGLAPGFEMPRSTLGFTLGRSVAHTHACMRLMYPFYDRLRAELMAQAHSPSQA
jgi:hypothetical protein